MNTEELTINNRRSYIGITTALLVATLITLAASPATRHVSGIPVFAICAAVAFIIQWAAFIPAYLKQTERYFDITGSITYISVILLSLLLSAPTDARGWLIATFATIWTVRLGWFLFSRIKKAGHDRRFTVIKPDAPRFFMTWTLQGLWVILTLACGLAAITATEKVTLGWTALLGTLLWATGFTIEVIADAQKAKFKANPNNAERFIAEGLWKYSRHPNYLGEILLWIGIAIIAAPALTGWQYATLISPVFVWLLLMKISGVPMLETYAQSKWGQDPDYQQYHASTPPLVPRLWC
ncbi:MAG: DUF1295 domain-containing protein [Pseudohongiellaceae bacterium]